MHTIVRLTFDDARQMRTVADQSVALVVTSPPYPMIQMWDDLFMRLNPAVGRALDDGDGWRAFERMHAGLLPVWREIYRILQPGGMACINIGDAVRTVGGVFRLFPNTARVQALLLEVGFSSLPVILWRKQTNAPNKFMGSGMLPPTAYVTLEHEVILVVRKGANRKFDREDQKALRRESAYFWEERNSWFSDVWWDVKGTGQQLAGDRVRIRSAAFPFEIPYRLISMFSVKGDTVVDPFAGTGTTLAAAAAAGRNAVGFELESDFKAAVFDRLQSVAGAANQRIEKRLAAHLSFVQQKRAAGHRFTHFNRHYGFAVMTGQETELLLNEVIGVQKTADSQFAVSYSDKPRQRFQTAGSDAATQKDR